MAIIAIVRSVPQMLEPRVILVFFFSSIWIIYLETLGFLTIGPAQHGRSSEHLPVSSL
jgi:hypothetical protein